MNIQVKPDISGAADSCFFQVGAEAESEMAAATAEPLDTKLANGLLMKLIAFAELTEDLGRLEMDSGNDSLLPFHLKLIGSEIADTTCDLLDMIGHEESRQEDAQLASD